MECRAKIEIYLRDLRIEKLNYEEELLEIKKKNPQYDRHYTIRQKEEELKKNIFGVECKMEVLKKLLTEIEES